MFNEKQAYIDQIILVATNISNMIRSNDASTLIPNSEWTVAEAVAHLIVTQKILTSLLSGKKSQYIENTNDFIEEVSQKLSREFIAEINKKFLTKYSQRNNQILAKSLIDEIKLYAKESEKYASDHIFKTHYGNMTLLILSSYCLTHLLIHGCAIAKALKQHLPVTQKNAVLTLPFTKLVMVKLFDKKKAKNFTANFVINIRDTEKFSIICENGRLTIDSYIPQKIDCHISAEPLTFFLVSTGLISQWMPILRGELFIYGTKPWLAFKLQTLFMGL